MSNPLLRAYSSGEGPLSFLPALGDLLVGAVELLALALAPPFFSPAPPPGGGSLSGGIAAAAVLAALVVGAGRLRTRPGGRAGRGAAVLIGAAVAAALVAADVFRGDRAPLGRGVLFVGVPLWAGLALLAGGVAERRFGGRARLLAPALVAAAFGVLLAGAAGWLLSPERMWLAALARDGDDAVAIEALTGVALRGKRYDAVQAVLDRCLAANPGACACLARRADVAVRTGPPARALAEARAAFARCPASPSARASAAEALAIHGDPVKAEQEARAGLAMGDDGRLHHALALALDRSGRAAEALEEARRAVKLGAGRDASLALGSLAIRAGDLEAAAEALGPLVAADPGDAAAQYDLALVADRRGEYNRAREGYLAALRADPQQAQARYNLVFLTLRQGALAEARHHLERFAAAFPGDPQRAVLARAVEEAARKAGASP